MVYMQSAPITAGFDTAESDNFTTDLVHLLQRNNVTISEDISALAIRALAIQVNPTLWDIFLD